MSEKWMEDAIKPSSKGKLHSAMGIPESKKLPAKKLEKETHSKNPTLKKEALLAETFNKYRDMKK